jgi:hypothetical protein
MICFDVGVNGSRVCRAGVEPRGVLHACAGWVHRPNEQAVPSASQRMRMSLDVGGMAFRGGDAYDYFRWRGRRLRLGDEVTIRVVEARSADRAASRKRDRPVRSTKLALLLLREAEDMLGRVPGRRARSLHEELRGLLQRRAGRQPRSHITRR